MSEPSNPCMGTHRETGGQGSVHLAPRSCRSQWNVRLRRTGMQACRVQVCRQLQAAEDRQSSGASDAPARSNSALPTLQADEGSGRSCVGSADMPARASSVHWPEPKTADLLAQVLEDLDLHQRLVMETLLVPNDLDRHVCPRLVVAAAHHLQRIPACCCGRTSSPQPAASEHLAGLGPVQSGCVRMPNIPTM